MWTDLAQTIPKKFAAKNGRRILLVALPADDSPSIVTRGEKTLDSKMLATVMAG